MISDSIKQHGAILISSWANISFLTSYFGFSQVERECFLLFTKNKKYLITDGRYKEAVKKETKGFEIIDIGASNFLLKDELKILKKLNKIAIEEDSLAVSELKKLKKHIKEVGKIDLSNLRIIKNENEIKNIKKACKIADNAFSLVLSEIKIGVSEKEIANKIELLIKNKNAEISFSPIVAFGKNSALPHHVSSQTKLRKNQIVLLDFGAKYNNYCSDMSRTIFFGKPNEKFKKMHSAVLEAQKTAIDYLNFQLDKHKTITGKNVDHAARQYLTEQGYPSIPHSVGHGIGVEVHEPPFLSFSSIETIKQGMVFSIEPGIYDPSFGGIRIEDLVLVKQNGIELISRSKKEIIELS